MPELPADKARLLLEGLSYAFRLPLIEVSWRICKPLIPPFSAGIMVTNRCNLDCCFCAVDRSSVVHDGLSREEFLDLIDRLADWGVRQITFTGGEPLMYEHFFELLEHAHRRGIITGFSTNGILLTEFCVKRLHSTGVDRISVSIDGPEKVHDRLRGRRGTYRRAVEGLQRLSRLRERYGKPELRINTIIFEQNLEHLTDMYLLAKRYGASLNLLPFNFLEIARPLRKLQDDVVKGLFVRGENLTALDEKLDELKALKREYGFLFNQDDFLEHLKHYYRNPTHVNRQCKYGAYHIDFLTNGDVDFCIYGSVGNTREKSPKEIWASARFNQMRAVMKRCKRCMLNCYYTPPLRDLVKDFALYPLLRSLKSR